MVLRPPEGLDGTLRRSSGTRCTFRTGVGRGGDVFNFQSAGVRQFLIDNARFYLDEYRVDGFRFDEVSVIDSNGYGRGWDFCQALTSTLREHRPGAIQHAEYWPVNSWVVKETFNGGAGYDTTLTDGLRIACATYWPLPLTPTAAPFPCRTWEISSPRSICTTCGVVCRVSRITTWSCNQRCRRS